MFTETFISSEMHSDGGDIPAPPSTEGPARGVYLLCKVVGDWVLAVTLTIMTAPVVLFFAALVKITSPGPAFYLQTRLGKGGRHYKIFKLRTMTHNCEASTGPVWAKPQDARVTPVGRFLRDTHLDELPQLWNVLQGNMSLVGPRPERPEIAARIAQTIPRFGDRLLVRPGVTGLAQMRLPADTDLEGVHKKLAHDLYYIEHVSLLLDLRIALSTAFYFIGAASEALCAVMVKSYGQAIERRLETRRAVDAERYEVETA